MNGMGSHQSACSEKDEWLTPPEIIGALGEFDLDPCAPSRPPWKTAARMIDQTIDGLKQEWMGRVWLNPPYGQETDKWMSRMVKHGNGIALIFARTETRTWFTHVWPLADAVFFFNGRLFFCHSDGHRSRTNAGAPSALIAFGLHNVEAIQNSKLNGFLVKLR